MATHDYDTINFYMIVSVHDCITAPHPVPDRKLIGPAGQGYMTADQYDVHFCHDVATLFNTRSRNKLAFSQQWKDDHKDLTVNGFIGASTNEAYKQANTAGS
jgi:hypothetical protein